MCFCFIRSFGFQPSLWLVKIIRNDLSFANCESPRGKAAKFGLFCQSFYFLILQKNSLQKKIWLKKESAQNVAFLTFVRVICFFVSRKYTSRFRKSLYLLHGVAHTEVGHFRLVGTVRENKLSFSMSKYWFIPHKKAFVVFYI